jgi:hypothetical protein
LKPKTAVKITILNHQDPLTEYFKFKNQLRFTLLDQQYLFTNEGKAEAVPLQAWSGPEGSRKLRFPDFMTTALDSGKVVSLTHRPPLP